MASLIIQRKVAVSQWLYEPAVRTTRMMTPIRTFGNESAVSIFCHSVRMNRMPSSFYISSIAKALHKVKMPLFIVFEVKWPSLTWREIANTSKGMFSEVTVLFYNEIRHPINRLHVKVGQYFMVKNRTNVRNWIEETNKLVRIRHSGKTHSLWGEKRKRARTATSLKWDLGLVFLSSFFWSCLHWQELISRMFFVFWCLSG